MLTNCGFVSEVIGSSQQALQVRRDGCDSAEVRSTSSNRRNNVLEHTNGRRMHPADLHRALGRNRDRFRGSNLKRFPRTFSHHRS